MATTLILKTDFNILVLIFPPNKCIAFIFNRVYYVHIYNTSLEHILQMYESNRQRVGRPAGVHVPRGEIR